MRFNIKKYLFLFAVLALPCLGHCQYYFDYNPSVIECYNLIIELKFEEAEEKLQKLSSIQENNLAITHIENYIDLFSIFIDEDKADYNRRKKQKNKRLDRIRQADDNEPYKLFALAEIKLQWAVAASKFSSQISILKDIYSAYRDLKENQIKFPDFKENKKSLSVIHAINETIPVPGFIKSLFALEGSIERGEKEILDLLAYSESNQSMFYPEAIASYAIITLYQRNDKLKAFDIISNSNLDPSKSPLVCFLFAKIAQRAGKNEAAINYLNSCPTGKEYKNFDYLNYLKGLSLIRKLDPEAERYLLAFVKNFKGRLYIKEAYQKLAWHALVIKEDLELYKSYMKMVKKHGTEIVDDDKQAHQEAKSKYIPHPELLKARLLFDGGYYKRSYDLLKANEQNLMSHKAFQLEFLYRLGRTSQAMGLYNDAINYFRQSIDKGQQSKEYYACNAALQMGSIYEHKNDFKKSKQYFKLCISMNPSKYKTSLHQKAKAGLDRIK